MPYIVHEDKLQIDEHFKCKNNKSCQILEENMGNSYMMMEREREEFLSTPQNSESLTE